MDKLAAATLGGKPARYINNAGAIKESDIVHENGNFWIARRKSQNKQIAPLGSVYYEVFEVLVTHSLSTGYFTGSLDRALRYCDKKAEQQKQAR